MRSPGAPRQGDNRAHEARTRRLVPATGEHRALLGLLSLLASAFRLRDRLQDRPSGTALKKATAKRVLEDDPQVAPDKRAALVRALVDTLFTTDYLAARGLSAEELSVHNGLVVAALGDLLDRWDEQVRAVNHGVDLEGPVTAFYLQATGLITEAIVRCAAYPVPARRGRRA
ncbi:MAG: hypothetical protein IT372_37950 [Polyangiaceae bacterium]|nr:hypothetical protein [Polyangiaceae bacterium]